MRFPFPVLVLLLLSLPVTVSADEAGVPLAGSVMRDATTGEQAAVPAVAPFPADALSGAGLTGGPGTYTVRQDDNLTLVAARLGASLRQLRRENVLDARALLHPGDVLQIDNRHVMPAAPQPTGQSILVNIPQRMLFFFHDGQLQAAFPAAAGRPDWQTPVGDTTVATVDKDKTWVVPLSIQREMRAKGEPVRTHVPPGPDNPLGRYWLGLALQGYGIHGTNAPASVYGARTHGCVRLQPEHIEALYQVVTKGAAVRIVYAPVLLFSPPDGPIWLEAHPDAYARGLDYPALARRLADEAGVTERIDWVAAESVLQAREGIARDVAARALPEIP